MKIHIENNLYIEGDDRNIEVREYTGKTDKDGKELFKNHGYFKSVQSAAKQIIRMKLAESSATNLKELIADMNRIEKEIENLIKY